MVLALLAWTLATASGGGAQELLDLKKPATPLVLQSQRSFIVGGDIVFSDALGSGGSGHIAVNQMYVQYKVPPSSRLPVVMVHGADLSGKSYETTPDGRMGWEEYFVRKGTQSISPTRSRGRDRDSTRLSSTACMQESRCRVRSPSSPTSTTRTLGQSSASVQPSAFPILTSSFRSRPWIASLDRLFRISTRCCLRPSPPTELCPIWL